MKKKPHNLRYIREWVRREQYLQDVRKQRKEFGLYYCQKCNDRLYGAEVHHFLCNKCWNEERKKKNAKQIQK